jgi:glycosyltransferase involved in cell wall biosynthesis
LQETPFLRIALLTDGIFPYVIGGMQKHSYYLCRFLLDLGVELTLFHCVTSGEIPSEETVRAELGISDDAKFKSICLRFPKGNGLPGHYLRSSFLYSKMQAEKLKKEAPFDFIYSKGFSAWALLDEKKRGKFQTPIGVKFHGYEMYQAPPNFKAKLQYMMLRGPVKFCNTWADVVFSYGGKITPIISSLGVAEENIIEIPTGIESKWLRGDDRQLKEASEPKKLLFLGRYERRKGIEELNEVLLKILDSTRFEVAFIGPIPASKHIKHERVLYHGKIMDQERIQEIMDQNDILLTPSHSEGMPNVIMEGMARSMAILATDVGAVPLQVDEQNGWRIEAANAQALEDTLLSIDQISPEELHTKQMASSKRIKDRFTWEDVSSSTLEAIGKYLSKEERKE